MKARKTRKKQVHVRQVGGWKHERLIKIEGM